MASNEAQTISNPEVMYIGFDPPKPSNGLGTTGFVVSLCSLLTCGLFSPIGLLLSVMALRKGPRGLATAGTLLGLLGMVPWAMTGLAVHNANDAHARRQEIRINRVAEQETHRQIDHVWAKLEDHRVEHGTYPAGIEGNKLAIPYVDGWNNSLRYEIHDNAVVVRSAGPDAEFESGDDVWKKRSTHDELQLLSMR
ncbi:MAG TPA: hypothetical protein DCY79_05430 [Planctomycetaceae bacterium]|nr:hypothetical protein [Blastopirellula sp.]HAY79231.1 hypothetical protein [Planctomycetaceae bacterium]